MAERTITEFLGAGRTFCAFVASPCWSGERWVTADCDDAVRWALERVGPQCPQVTIQAVPQSDGGPAWALRHFTCRTTDGVKDTGWLCWLGDQRDGTAADDPLPGAPT